MSKRTTSSRVVYPGVAFVGNDRSDYPFQTAERQKRQWSAGLAVHNDVDIAQGISFSAMSLPLRAGTWCRLRRQAW